MSRLFIRLSSAQITTCETRDVHLREPTMTAQSLRFLRHDHPRLLLLGSVLLATGMASCSPTVLPTATLWSANLRQEGSGGIQGTLGVVSQNGSTRASMSLTFGQSGITYLWRIATGDCASEGEIVGGRAAYPPLVPGDSGGDAEYAVLAGELTSGGSYAARILEDTGNGSEQVAACSALVQTK
jgi:hypothetical protein